MAAKVTRRGGKKNRKHGRSQRPGRRAKTTRSYAGIAVRKRKRILRSNGAAFLAAWESA